MRNIYRMTLALLLAAGIDAAAQQVEWKSAGPPGITGSLVRDIIFPTPTIGYMTAYPLAGETRTQFYTTTNGGANWASQEIESFSISESAFTSVEKGYLLGIDTQCSCTVVYSTTNGGDDWTKKTMPGSSQLYTLEFASESNGFAGGQNGTLVRTTNGGDSWSLSTLPGGSTLAVRSIDFPTESVGYIVAAKPNEFPTILFKTTDGGSNWQKIQEFTDGRAFNQIDFVTPQIGYAAGRSPKLALFKTTDGGASWKTQFEMVGYNSLLSFYRVNFIDENTGYAAGDQGQIRRTTDGGATWPYDYSLGQQVSSYALEVIDTNTVWAAGIDAAAGAPTAVMKRTSQLMPLANISTAKLDFGKMSSGTKELTMTISAGNAAGLTISSVRLDDANAATKGFTLVEPTGSFPRTLEEGSSLTVKVSFTPPAGEPRKMFSSLAIETDDPVRKIVYIQLVAEKEGAATGQPSAVVNTTTLAFGEVERSSTKKLSFTVAAGNAAGLRVDSIWIEQIMGSTGSFRILSPTGAFPMNVASGAPMTVEVLYSPTVANEEAMAEMIITTNDPANDEIHIALTGESTEPSASIAGDAVASAGLALRADPNPLGAAGRINLQIASRASIRVTLVDLLGNTVATLHDGTADAGSLSLPIDAAGLAEGIYYCVAETPGGRVVLPLNIAR